MNVELVMVNFETFQTIDGDEIILVVISNVMVVEDMATLSDVFLVEFDNSSFAIVVDHDSRILDQIILPPQGVYQLDRYGSSGEQKLAFMGIG